VRTLTRPALWAVRGTIALALALATATAGCGSDEATGGASSGDPSASAPPSVAGAGAPPPSSSAGLARCFDEVPAIAARDMRAFSDTLAHGETFTPITSDDVNALASATRSLLDGDVAVARTGAKAARYEIVPLVTSECLWVMRPDATGPKGQGVLVVRPAFARDLVLEVPHIPYDTNSDVEASIVFDTTSARAIAFAGAIRCAVDTPSGCGTSSACSAGSSPPESDPSHSVTTAFHGFHLGAGTGASTSLVVQLHANEDRTTNGDALVTNGTRASFAGSTTERFYRALVAETNADVRTCNDPQAPPSKSALCGVSNTQGHASNGVEACNGTATAASDRFIHVEQNVGMLIEHVDTWSAHVAVALERAFDAR
jgi:hypothetical protein